MVVTTEDDLYFECCDCKKKIYYSYHIDEHYIDSGNYTIGFSFLNNVQVCEDCYNN